MPHDVSASSFHVANQLQQLNNPQNNGPQQSGPAAPSEPTKRMPNVHESADIARRIDAQEQPTPRIPQPRNGTQAETIKLLVQRPSRPTGFTTPSGNTFINMPHFAELRSADGSALIFDRDGKNYIFQSQKTGAVYAARADGKYVVQYRGAEVISNTDGSIDARRPDGAMKHIEPQTAGVEYQLESEGYLPPPVAQQFEAMHRLREGLGSNEEVRSEFSPSDAAYLNAAQLADYSDSHQAAGAA